MACINLSWKQLLKRKTALRKNNEDYIYLQWHFMTSNHPSGSSDSHSSDHHRDFRRVETEEDEPSVPDPQQSSMFSDIRTWLASQPDTFCAEIYCDCCDPSLDPLYSAVNTSLESVTSSSRIPDNTESTFSNINRRQDSVSSVVSTTLSMSSSDFTSDEEQDESNYSLQIRRKSKSLFRSRRTMI